MDSESLQQPFDAAVVIPSILRPTLTQAIQSVFAQDLPGRIQILLGIDKALGDRAQIDRIRAECPARIALTVVDPGYSTSQRHGSLYSNHYGGSLRTALSYLANSRFVAYLDDDTWYAPGHLAALLAAIAGKSWAYTMRTLVDDKRDEVICPDEWESVGPGRGVYAPAFGGFVGTTGLMLDKLACHEVLPAWSMSRYTGGGGGEDRMVFERLKGLPFGATGRHTVYYRTTLNNKHPYLLWKYRQAGVDLARYMSPEKIPADAAWAECEAYDRAEQERASRLQAEANNPPAVSYRGAEYSISYPTPKPPREKP